MARARADWGGLGPVWLQRALLWGCRWWAVWLRGWWPLHGTCLPRVRTHCERLSPPSLQGGIGPAGLATEDLHVLDFTDPERPRWHRWGEGEGTASSQQRQLEAGGAEESSNGARLRQHLTDRPSTHTRLAPPHACPSTCRVLVQGAGPSARYAHTLSLVANRFLVAMGGNDGKSTLGDAWALDTSEKPYQWRKITDAGDMPSPRY